MRETRDLRPDAMTLDELTFELRRVRNGHGSEQMDGGWKRPYELRQGEIERELLSRLGA